MRTSHDVPLKRKFHIQIYLENVAKKYPPILQAHNLHLHIEDSKIHYSTEKSVQMFLTLVIVSSDNATFLDIISGYRSLLQAWE